MILANYMFNHLWQSTLFAVVVGLLTLALRTNRAQQRHWLWLAASVKFLIPFSLLVGVGSHLGWKTARLIAPPGLYLAMEEISQPFGQPELTRVSRTAAPTAIATLASAPSVLLLCVWFCGCAAVLFFWWIRWLRVTTAVRAALPFRDGRELEMVRRLEHIAGIEKQIELVSSRSPLEPGVFGILRPVLWLPAGISDRLSDAQLEAILAHELCHVHRCDNLAAAVHMVVEAIFWFHPLVWWLGARLVEERERSCDEEVLRQGSDPEVYAESILKVCEFYLESPLVCVAGVTGADLKKRIEEIMTHRVADKLDFGRKLLIATMGMAAVTGPIAIGLMQSPQSRAQAQPAVAASPAFEVASVKMVKGPVAPHPVGLRINHGTLNIDAARLRQIIGLAYAIQRVRVYGGPSWLDSEMYDIVAKAESTDASRDQIRAMLQTLLADRFILAVHRETKELPVYTLVVGKNGSKLQKAKDEEKLSVTPLGRGRIAFQKENMGSLANTLANLLGSPVSDQTGIEGFYDFKLEWTDAGQSQRPENGNQPTPVDSAPDIFAAVQDQLGLKLEVGKGPVEVLVIDHAERVPTEN